MEFVAESSTNSQIVGFSTGNNRALTAESIQKSLMLSLRKSGQPTEAVPFHTEVQAFQTLAKDSEIEFTSASPEQVETTAA